MDSKTLKFRGLDLRSNMLEREGNTARDCSNVRLDHQENLVKREEFAALGLTLSKDDEEILDIVEFKGKIIVLTLFTATGATFDKFNAVYSYDIALDTLTEIINDSNAPQWYAENVSSGSVIPQIKTFTGKVTSFEKNDCLYFISNKNETNVGYAGLEGVPEVIKYDGSTWYMSGVARAQANTVVDVGLKTTPNFYGIILPFYIDAQGNQTLGTPTYSDVVVSGPTDYTADDFLAYDMIVGPYMCANIQVNGNYLGTSGATVSVNCNATFCVAGQHLLHVRNNTSTAAIGLSVRRYEIMSVISATSVVLGNMQDYVSGEWVDNATTVVYFIDNEYVSGVVGALYSSAYIDSGFTFASFTGMSTGTATATALKNITSTYQISQEIIISQNLEDCYELSTTTVNPPPGVQIREYGTAAIVIDKNNLYFSNTGLNGTVENFTGFDNFVVGDDDKGEIISFFSNPTMLAVFRERESYLVSGNIFTGNISIRSFRSTGIGGKAPSSVGDLKGQCIFASNLSIESALENGEISPIGDRIETLFHEDLLSLGLDLGSCDLTLDVERSNILMAIQGSSSANSVILVYDYRNNEWFKYDMDCKGGILIDHSDGKLYYSNGSDIYAEQVGYSAGVDADWKSNFETLGKAAFKKRFQRLTLFDTYYASGDIGFKSYKNWKTATEVTNVTLLQDDDSPIPSKRLNPDRCLSCAFDIASLGVEPLKLDGFEYDFSIEQEESNKDGR